MGIFDRKLEREYKALQKEVAELKGFYDDLNEENKLFKKIYPYSGEMVEFASFSRGDLKSMYKNISSVYGIIDRIAKSAAEVSQYIELQDKADKVIEQHWINTLLANPNDRHSLNKFIYAWATNKLLYGDVFVYCNKTLGSKREVKEMYVAPGDRVAIDTGGWRNPFNGIKITDSGDGETIPKGEVWQSWYWNPDSDSLFGFSPLSAAAQEVQIIRNGKRRQNTSMVNGAVNTLITPKPDQMGLMPKDTEDLDRELNSEKNINKSKYLRQAIEVHKIGGSPVELSILDGTKESVTALCFVYNIPVDLYYGQSKYENAREARKTLYESIAIPLVQEFCNDFMGYLNREFKETKGLKLYVNPDKIDVLKASPTETLTNLGLMGASLNEKREAYGYAPINKPYANEPMLPLGIQFGEATYDINENEPI